MLLKVVFSRFASLPATMAQHFTNWTIAARVMAIVITLALPLNLVVVAVIWNLDGAADEAQRASLLYSARSLAAAVDSELSKYIALAQALSRSPALFDDNLDIFDAEARRAFASMQDASFLVADLNGRQLINGATQPGEPLPHRQAAAIRAQNRALESRSIVVSDVFMDDVMKDWAANVDVPVFKNGQPFRALAVTMRVRSFLRLINAREMPKNWKVGIIDGQGRFIARVPDHAANVGQLASEGWREVKDQDGIFEFFHSSEGSLVANASAHPVLSDWTVGAAIRKTELHGPKMWV